MQDKEFDKLLNSKFAEFEMEPSPMVWENIAGELHGKKAKSSLMPYLSIAASVIILVSAGVLFFGQNETSKPPVKPKLAAKYNQPETIAPAKADVKVPVTVQTKSERVVSAGNAGSSLVYDVPEIKNIEPINASAVTGEPIKNNESLLATSSQATQFVSQAIVPGKDIPLTIKEAAIEQPAVQEKPTIVLASAQPQAAVKKRGIHSLGGLINAIVAKVDKRDDKVIEFTDSDDDDSQSSLTGVNLGILKIKKQ